MSWLNPFNYILWGFRILNQGAIATRPSGEERRNGVQVDEPEPISGSHEPLPTPERLPWAAAYSDVAY